MLVGEAGRLANLTKKAIEYYTQQGLVTPNVLQNGYREYSERDIESLKRVSVLRRLGVGTEEIRAILSDETGSALQNAALKKELEVLSAERKKELLLRLSSGKDYSEISAELQAVQNTKTITEKLLEAFPGYFGRFMCLHFSRFLNEPIETAAQQSAFETIVSFLDNVPAPDFPDDVKDFLADNTKHIGSKQIAEMLNSTKLSIENPDEFLIENKAFLEQYLTLKQSAEYKASAAYKLSGLMSEFCHSSGYYDVFIPAMKRLSRSYSDYSRQLEAANKKLLESYPEIEGLER